MHLASFSFFISNPSVTPHYTLTYRDSPHRIVTTPLELEYFNHPPTPHEIFANRHLYEFKQNLDGEISLVPLR